MEDSLDDILPIILLAEDNMNNRRPHRGYEEGRRVDINVEQWSRLNNSEFKKHFRMDTTTFENLVLVVGRHMSATNRLHRKGATSVSVGLMMTLWILATPDCFRSVGVKFEKSSSSVHNQYTTMIEVLRELAPAFISWPNAFEKEAICAEFEARYGYPSTIGCIDGCLIHITAPADQPQRYVDRHHNYSITLQGVCDHKLLFRDVYVGQPGSVGDSRTFQRSPLGQMILRDLAVMDDKHLVGDGAFTITDKLLVPFRDNGHLTQRQRIHNYYLSRCRSCIERAFALLKNKWRRLKFFPSFCLEFAVDHIVACIVLHNFIILDGMEYEDRGVIRHNFVPDNINDRELLQIARNRGLAKREYITNLLAGEE